MAKVLLVEDDNNLREIYQARLAAEGYDIATAENGEAALVIAKQTRPDLIISDVMMPRISGFEMLDILRNTNELKNTKVIMLTALSQAEDQTRADSLGADRYLVKSQVTLEDIVGAAKELLSDDGAAPAPAQQVTDTTAAAPAPAPAPTAPAEESVAPTTDTPAITEPTPVAVPPAEPAPAPNVQPAPPSDPVASSPPVSVAPQADATVVVPPAPANPAPPAVTITPVAPSAGDTADTAPVTPPASAPAPAPSAVPSTDTEEQAAPDASPAAADSASQPVKTEEAAVEAQIENFVNQVPAAPPAAVAPTTDSNDETLASAVDQLNPPEQPVSTPAPDAGPAITPAQPTTPAAPAEGQPGSLGGTKVIQPINDMSQKGPDLDELLAREEAREAGNNPAPAPQQPQAPSQDIDPNSISL